MKQQYIDIPENIPESLKNGFKLKFEAIIN